MQGIGDESSGDSAGPSARRLSYKFQRLRERIRAAIDAGELAGKLPGERSLARQFNVNAKTLSKALTDLAAEGVLERNIGLGTFVRDGGAAPPAVKVLLLADPGDGAALDAALAARGLDVTTYGPSGDLPPSLVAPYDLVLIASPTVSEQAVRDLIVRGKSVVTLDRLSRPYSTHALLPHTTLAATQAARDLITLGHRRLLLIPDDPSDPDSHRAVVDSLPHAEVRTGGVEETVAAARDGITGVVCGAKVATGVIEACRIGGVDVPGAVSVIAYGRLGEVPACCGHYVTDGMVADAVTDVLAAGLPHKPLMLWLAGRRTDLGTTAPPQSVTR